MDFSNLENYILSKEFVYICNSTEGCKVFAKFIKGKRFKVFLKDGDAFVIHFGSKIIFDTKCETNKDLDVLLDRIENLTEEDFNRVRK